MNRTAGFSLVLLRLYNMGLEVVKQKMNFFKHAWKNQVLGGSF